MSTVVWWKRSEDVVADCTATIKQSKEDLSLERKINSSLLEEFSAIKRELDKLKDRNETLVKVNEELTENLEAVESRTRDIHVELFRKLEEASSQINKLQKTLYLRDSELAIARSANDVLKKKVIELEGMLKATNEKCDKKKLKHENEVLENTIIKLNREKMDLLERLDDRDGEIHDLKEKIIGLEQEKAYYKRQVDLVSASVKDLIEKLQAEKK